MRRMLLAVFAFIFAVSLVTPARAQGSPPQGGADQPYAVEYYYKLQWGHQQKFLQLFLKNHYGKGYQMQLLVEPEDVPQLVRAVEQFLLGQPIEKPETASYGCAIQSVYYTLPKAL